MGKKVHTHCVCVYSVMSDCVCVYSVMSDPVIPVTTALQDPLSMEFLGQEHWSGLPLLPPGDRPYPGIESTSLASPVLQADSLLERQLTERNRKAKGTGLGQTSPLVAETGQNPEP